MLQGALLELEEIMVVDREAAEAQVSPLTGPDYTD